VSEWERKGFALLCAVRFGRGCWLHVPRGRGVGIDFLFGWRKGVEEVVRVDLGAVGMVVVMKLRRGSGA
jgi:hypothetical protein